MRGAFSSDEIIRKISISVKKHIPESTFSEKWKVQTTTPANTQWSSYHKTSPHSGEQSVVPCPRRRGGGVVRFSLLTFGCSGDFQLTVLAPGAAT